MDATTEGPGLPTEKLFKERQGKSEGDKAKAQQKRVNP